MTALGKLNVVYSGWNGGPGVNTLYFSAGTVGAWDDTVVQQTYDEVHALYSAIAGVFRTGMFIDVAQELQIIDSVTGDLTDIKAVPETDAQIPSTGGESTTATSSMIVVRFTTSKFLYGRQLKGRAFMGPLNRNQFTADGSITTGAREAIDDAFVAITSGLGPRLAVFKRPDPAKDRPGDYADVVSATAQPKPGVLRSRRD
jgi:hypothetical protein